MLINDNVIVTQKQNTSYIVRRKVQKLVGRLFGPRFSTIVMFYIAKRKRVDLKNPKTFSEKICWYKLNYCPNSELVIKCADKYSVRNYLLNKGLGSNLTNIVGVWNKAENINWDALPNQFAIKCSHGCAYNIICLNKSDLNNKEATKTLNKWLHDDFGYYNGEPHYNIGERRIICEEYIDSSERLPVDYKVHCMNGVARIIQVIDDREKGLKKHSFYSIDGKPVNYGRIDTKRHLDIDNNLLSKMVMISNKIAVDFPYVRVDCYINNNSIVIGELTFSPGAGILHSLSDIGESEMGKMLDLDKIR